MISDDIRADRSLLLPGPLPPLSHLGATLLRHSVHTATRYALYQLGQKGPESPPLRFVSLRPYLDVPKLSRCLDQDAASRAILSALVDPGGVAEEPLPRRLAGAVWFHRRRLGVRQRLPGRRPSARPPADATSAVLRSQLSSLLPALGEALLGELLASLERRQWRLKDRATAPVQSRQAARFLVGKRANLSTLGLPDPRTESWEAKPAADPSDSALASLERSTHRLRGGFRERYRLLLDRLRPRLLELGRKAVGRGHLKSTDDLFFLPFDLLDDLEADVKPDWLDGALASNRTEWLDLQSRGAPADTLGNVEPPARLELAPELSSLTPLL